MTQEFVKQNNTAVAASLLLLKALKSPEMEQSAWFNFRNLKRSMATKSDLERIWEKVQTSNPQPYVQNMEQMSDLLEEVISNIFEAAAKGVDGEYITLIRNGVSLVDQVKAKGTGMSALIGSRPEIKIGM
jgi:spore germination protein GerM